jgi:hypothetical protein
MKLRNYFSLHSYYYILPLFCCLFLFSCKNSTSSSVAEVDSVALKKEETRIKKEINADQKAILIEQVIQQKIAEGFNGNVLIAQKGVVRRLMVLLISKTPSKIIFNQNFS